MKSPFYQRFSQRGRFHTNNWESSHWDSLDYKQ